MRLQPSHLPQFSPFSISLEMCQTRESWCMNQRTVSKNNFVSGKFCARDMNELQQAFSRSEEV